MASLIREAYDRLGFLCAECDIFSHGKVEVSGSSSFLRR